VCPATNLVITSFANGILLDQLVSLVFHHQAEIVSFFFFFFFLFCCYLLDLFTYFLSYNSFLALLLAFLL
jgi:hypothetical protein